MWVTIIAASVENFFPILTASFDSKPEVFGPQYAAHSHSYFHMFRYLL